MLVPVALAYREAYSKNGYLKRLAAITAHRSPKPYSAPALVDCTKWLTPMHVLANRIPGPRDFRKALSFDFIGAKYSRLVVLRKARKCKVSVFSKSVI